ncbi:MAG: TolC family protein [Planctomycetes bacterium]|nr:TolC family protein [Planctomycetota bacterium]
MTPRCRSRRAIPCIGVVASIVAFAGGCASWLAADANREVAAVLAEYQSRVLGDRAQWVRRPAAQPVEPASTTQPSKAQPGATNAKYETAPPPPRPEVRILDRRGALEQAFASGRDILDAREAIYLNGLGWTLTRYNFGPLLNSTISYVWNDAEDASASDALAATFGINQILPLGGRVAVNSSLNAGRANDPSLFDLNQRFLYDSSVRVNWTQPLLRGAGYEASHEALTQSERNLIYAVRAFELFRQDFAIRVANAYYQLVGQKTRLANDEQNYTDAVFDREKAEALRKVDRNEDDDVFLARRREIEAEDALLVARTDYELAVDVFKILLGLPTAAEIRIMDEEPEFRSIAIDPETAVKIAHYNRLDLHTQRERVEDVERGLRLARNGLLPDLDLSVNYGLDGGTRAGEDATPSHRSASIGVTLEVPLDRKAERNAYRSAQIGLDRARRDFEQRLDEVERDVLNQLRELGQIEKRIQLQVDQIEFEKRAVAVTRFRYEAGDVDNRALLEARQGLTNAQNALIDLKVDHFIARLQLRRDLGVLFIDTKGMWTE